MEITLQEVKDLLESYGVVLLPTDDALIEHFIKAVSQHIMNETNQPSVPQGAYYVALDMVCAEFMRLKYAMGQLDIDNIVIDINSSAVTSVKDGDTDVKFAESGKGGSGTPLDRFNSWLDSLFHYEYDWSIWRRLRW